MYYTPPPPPQPTANEPGATGPAIDITGSYIYSGLMVVLAVAALLSAVLLSRRERWARTLSAIAQVGFVLALVAAPLSQLNSHIAVLLVFTAPSAGAAVLAAVNLVLLSRPTVGQWYSQAG